jgi:hypothetical protein
MSGAPESGGGEGGFRARAGALTLLFLTTSMRREMLRPLLAEAATGVELVDKGDLPSPDDPLDYEIIVDPYLVEPADPAHGPDEPIGPDTMLQPTAAGREVPFVGTILQEWLNRGPDGPVELGPDAGPALWALLAGWSSTVVHAFAAEPRTVAEATEAIQVLDPELVETHVAAMVETGLLEALPGPEGAEQRFEVTDWLRMAVAPLAVAARMELRHPPGDTAPIAALDVEAAFQLTLPLLELPPDLYGSCSLAVELDEGVLDSPSGVTARIDRGRVLGCEPHLDEEADSRASATAPDWLEMVIEGDAERAEAGGDPRIAAALLQGLHETLFGGLAAA